MKGEENARTCQKENNQIDGAMELFVENGFDGYLAAIFYVQFSLNTRGQDVLFVMVGAYFHLNNFNNKSQKRT